MDYQVLITGAAFAIANTILNTFPWAVGFILLKYVNICAYRVTDREKVLRIQRRVKNSSFMTDDNKAFGYAVGKWYILHLSAENDIYAWVLTSPSCFAVLTAPFNDINEIKGLKDFKEENKDYIDVYKRCGNYNSLWYRRSRSGFKAVEPYAKQHGIIEKIEDHFRENRHTVALISGAPGTGKTMIGKILAQRLNGAYCNTLKPWTPGDNLDELYNEAEPGISKPLIVAFDEIDVVIDMINKNSIPVHKNVPVSVKDKTGWNTLFDMIDDGMYCNLIVVMTSNLPDYPDDKSLLRNGRVNLKFTL